MVVTWVLRALVAFGLLVVAVAAVEVGLAETPATGIAQQCDSMQGGCAPNESNGATGELSQTGQRRGSPSSWLLGLGLVVVLARLGEDGAGLDFL